MHYDQSTPQISDQPQTPAAAFPNDITNSLLPPEIEFVPLDPPYVLPEIELSIETLSISKLPVPDFVILFLHFSDSCNHQYTRFPIAYCGSLKETAQ
jgi:hypothetical protein